MGKPPLYRLLAEIFFDFLFVDYPALLEQMMTRTGSTFHLLLVTDADLFFHWLEVHHTTHQTALTLIQHVINDSFASFLRLNLGCVGVLISISLQED